MAGVDLSAICPSCLKTDALSNGVCRFCRKSVPQEWPIGVLSPGTILKGRYVTGLILGQGGFGVTYRAYDLVDQHAVAIKEYYPNGCGWCSRQGGNSGVSIREYSDFEYGLKHFKGEAEVLQKMADIPEIVRYYDSFSENNTAYYVMELLNGRTLNDSLSDQGNPYRFSHAVRLLMPVMFGLEEIHKRNAIHRDIKPANIFLCEDGAVKILDFGAAAAEGSVFADSFMPIWSEGYSPPEQNTISHDRGKQGPWSDVYALAGTLYRCVTGRRPPSSSERLAGDEIHFESNEVTQKQRSVLEKNLSLEPKNRCQTMLAFADELLACLKKSEEESIRKQYPELEKARNAPQKRPVPSHEETGEKERKEWNKMRLAAAYCVDLFLFQATPYVLSRMTGMEAMMALLAGYVLGTVCAWGMTVSKARGSPGQRLFGIVVKMVEGEKPESRAALLYCMLRMLWPIKPIDLGCFLIKGETMTRRLSGCTAMEKEPTLIFTEGLYAGTRTRLPAGEYVVGRNPSLCNFIFPMTYNTVSRVQCSITVDEKGDAHVTNKSSRGTTVDGRELTGDGSAQLKAGSEIAFGREKMMINYE